MNLEEMEAALRSGPFPDLVAKELEPIEIKPEPFTLLRAFERVSARVCDVPGITLEILRGPKRDRFTFYARAVIAFIGVKDLHMTRGQVGRWLNKDNTTITNAVRRAEELQHRDPEFATLLRVARGAL